MNEKRLSKGAQLSEILRKPDVLDQIGAGWRLFFSLVLVESGSVVGTYDEIAEKLGGNGRTVRSWANELMKSGIIERQQQGRRVRLTLLEPFMMIAKSPNCIIETSPGSDLPQDPQTQRLLEIGRTAKEAGSKIEIKLVV